MADQALSFEECAECTALPVKATIAVQSPFVCDRLRSFLGAYLEIEVIADSFTSIETLDVLKRHRPALVILDKALIALRYPRDLLLEENAPQLILLNEEGQRTRRTGSNLGVQWLSMRCTRAELLHAVGTAVEAVRARSNRRELTYASLIRLLSARPEHPATTITARSASGFLCLRPGEIRWVENTSRGAIIHPVHTPHRSLDALGSWQQVSCLLLDAGFVYLNAKTIVNIAQVHAIHIRFQEPHSVELRGGLELSIAKSYLPQLLKHCGLAPRSAGVSGNSGAPACDLQVGSDGATSLLHP